MLTSVSGIYENGKITLDETPAVQKKSKIVVTFLEEMEESVISKRRLGSLKGKIGTPDDFNAPMDELNDYML
ncbi:hypothetical protein GCM10010967_08740 [Dyadobacter beijingensis]|uniref:DUF2281 domain-containing protein n=1 Tax=Dyadobacter beijingensis TaxID=365489 RepID=A0ABQ2HEU0_9BACT|nr:hypothetical protein [Dyadobacter beijingensis]GGM79280.1 hypothetical protein GCM10010967_08740 [Dyadobacter beijingensis]